MLRGIGDRVRAPESRRERDVYWFGRGIYALVLSSYCNLLKKFTFIEGDSSHYFGTASFAFALLLRGGELRDVSAGENSRR